MVKSRVSEGGGKRGSSVRRSERRRRRGLGGRRGSSEKDGEEEQRRRRGLGGRRGIGENIRPGRKRREENRGGKGREGEGRKKEVGRGDKVWRIIRGKRGLRASEVLVLPTHHTCKGRGGRRIPPVLRNLPLSGCCLNDPRVVDRHK